MTHWRKPFRFGFDQDRNKKLLRFGIKLNINIIHSHLLSIHPLINNNRI